MVLNKLQNRALSCTSVPWIQDTLEFLQPGFEVSSDSPKTGYYKCIILIYCRDIVQLIECNKFQGFRKVAHKRCIAREPIRVGVSIKLMM